MMSLPSKRTSPEVGSIIRRISRPVVDLPHPDSPTMPSVSPRYTEKLTPSTALTMLPRRMEPEPEAGKYFTRLDTFKSSSAMNMPASSHGR